METFRVLQTADPEEPKQDSSASVDEFVITNSAGEGFILTGKFWALSAGKYKNFLVTVAHPLIKTKTVHLNGKIIGNCVIVRPDDVECDGTKYTADVAIVKLDNNNGLQDPKVCVKFNDGTTLFDGRYQPKLFCDEVVNGTTAYVLNKEGNVMCGRVELMPYRPIKLCNNKGELTGECTIYYNLYKMCNDQKMPITEPGDSGCIGFLKPEEGKNTLEVFAMCTSRDIVPTAEPEKPQNFLQVYYTYAVNLPKVLKGITNTAEFRDIFGIGAKDELKFDFCGVVDTEEMRNPEAESGIDTGETRMDTAESEINTAATEIGNRVTGIGNEATGGNGETRRSNGVTVISNEETEMDSGLPEMDIEASGMDSSE